MGFFSDAWDAATSAVSAVADTVESGVSAVVDTVEDAADWLADQAEGLVDDGVDAVCSAGAAACFAAKIIGGVINGSIEAGRSLLDVAADSTRDVTQVMTSIGKGDFARAFNRLVATILDGLRMATVLTRFMTGGYFVGGVVRQFKREALREFVDTLVKKEYATDPSRIQRVRRQLGLDGSKRFGWRIDAVHRVFMLDSAAVPLYQWQEDGAIDLYGLANVQSFHSFNVWPRPRTVVTVVRDDGTDSLMPINRWIISHYLDSKGADYRLRVYAMTPAAIGEHTEAATRKLKGVGILASWNVATRFVWFNRVTHVHEITTKEEFDFTNPTHDVDRYVYLSGLRSGTHADESKPLALGCFNLDSFGWTAGRLLHQSQRKAPCSTPNRTDSCCCEILYERTVTGIISSRSELPKERVASGVIYRDVSPYFGFRYVLVHELGHYLGLCHLGHNPSEIMYTVKRDQGSEDISWGLFSYYWEDEPHFSLEDGRNMWRYLLHDLEFCFP